MMLYIAMSLTAIWDSICAAAGSCGTVAVTAKAGVPAVLDHSIFR
jgi:hypothetical protein